MSMVDLAASFMRQAKARLSDAHDALDDENHPYAFRLSQESVEFSLKAVLRLVAVEYPRVHDVSRVLEMRGSSFPKWFQERLPFLCETSSKLAKKRAISFYGVEERLLAPEKVIGREDAVDAVQRAEEAFRLCERLFSEYGRKAG